MRDAMSCSTTQTLIFPHVPKCGGTTVAALFQPTRRLHAIIPALSVVPAGRTISFHGGHRTAQQLERFCARRDPCCVWLIILRDPIARLVSAFATSQEDHQHFDCSHRRLHARLRDRSNPLTIEELALAPLKQLASCNLNTYLDVLAPQRGNGEAKRLRHARSRIASDDAVVGVHERMGQTLQLLAHRLSLNLSRYDAFFTYNPHATIKLTAKARRRLKRVLAPDYELYSAARRTFEARWEALRKAWQAMFAAAVAILSQPPYHPFHTPITIP